MNGGRLKGFTTPGGHRRVEEADLVTFMREQGMPVPSALGGSQKVPDGCQHVHLTSSVNGTLASCDECRERFKLVPLTQRARKR
jgi:hypothetical protein